MPAPWYWPDDAALDDVATTAAGPAGALPFTDDLLRNAPSGDLFGWSQDAAMGWTPAELGRHELLILSTLGGVRAPDGSPIALGYHTGHWEVGLLVEAAAREVKARGGVPFAGFCSDPCDGRTQGTAGMFDSLPYRNDAAIVLRRLIRSLPTRRGVIGVATCDKGHPAMMMALAGAGDLPAVLVPGGVSLPPTHGEDAGKIQSIGARYAHGLVTLAEAAELGCRACATPGGGCQFLGTAATSQVVGEALGLSLPHSALAPSGQPIWLDAARRAAEACFLQHERGLTVRRHRHRRRRAQRDGRARGLRRIDQPAAAPARRRPRRRPRAPHRARLDRSQPHDAAAGERTAQWPHRSSHRPRVSGRRRARGHAPPPRFGPHRRHGPHRHGPAAGAKCSTPGAPRRARERLRDALRERDGVDPDDVIFSPARAAEAGLRGTLAFLTGNIAPEGSVVKATTIDPALLTGGCYAHVGRARVFTSEPAAMAAIKGQLPGSPPLEPGDVLVLAGCGPLGTGMEETYQLTSALRHLPWGKHVPLVTDARFSGVSTGACIGHVGPEALAGGPLGKLLDDDLIEITIDSTRAEGSVDLVGHGDEHRDAAWGAAELARRPLRADLAPAANLPADTRLWAALQAAAGGTWGGCVYDLGAIIAKLSS